MSSPGTSASPDSPAPHPPGHAPLLGALCGLAAAVGYTLANIALRWSSDLDPVWVTSVKAIPTVLATAPVLLWRRSTGRPATPSWEPLPWLIAGVFVGQLIGNVLFQYSLGVIGLALSVPINLGAMIIVSALLARTMLGEPVTPRTLLAIAVLIVAVTILSLGSGAVREGPGRVAGIGAGRVALGVLATCASGAGYALFGTVMRRSLRGGMPVSLTMFASGVFGLFGLGSLALLRIGPAEMAATTLSQWGVMFAAGMFNLFAFYALSLSLRSIPVVAVNLLNATQAAMAATAGVLLFAEPTTWPLAAGLLLTVVGLVILGSRRPRRWRRRS